MKIADLDFVYISYDEPNAEENYHDLLSKKADAKRVDKVKGFDKAHQRAGEIATTEFVVIVDGDNRVVKELFFPTAEIAEDLLKPNQVISWSSKNVINGLIYGNGGLKIWPRDLLKTLDCHDSGKGNDWCFQIPYFQMNDWYSYSFCNASPFQAFRAGFREGIKLTLNLEGQRFPEMLSNINVIPEVNIRRLLAWMNVGSDAVNGRLANYGARLGFLKSVCEEDFDINVISDFGWIDQYWNNEMSYVKEGFYHDHLYEMGRDIEKITGLPVCELNEDQSKLAKQLIFNPKRVGLMIPANSENDQTVKESSKSKEL
jgi:hypothetical protein